VEETFHIEVQEEDMLPENLDSIGNITRFVAKKLKEKAPA
jgi:acyl carrier protein